MKKRIFLICSMTLLIISSLFSQVYHYVDEIVKNYPTSNLGSDDLVDLINNDFVLDVDKARAIYTWIALNIDYDVEASSLEETFSYKSDRNKTKTEKRIREKWAKNTLATGMAECEGYATLYYFLCELMLIECDIVPGTSRTSYDQIGTPPGHVNHAWNAVKINNEWKFIDVTWGAGDFDHSTKTFHRQFDPTYFLVSPDRFFLQHFPLDTTYLFTNKTAEEFTNLPIFYSDYIFADYELVYSQSGILPFEKNGVVKLIIKSESGLRKISYGFDYEYNYDMVEAKKNGQFYELEVPFPEKKKNYLTLFYDGLGLMTFKIK